MNIFFDLYIDEEVSQRRLRSSLPLGSGQNRKPMAFPWGLKGKNLSCGDRRFRPPNPSVDVDPFQTEFSRDIPKIQSNLSAVGEINHIRSIGSGRQVSFVRFPIGQKFHMRIQLPKPNALFGQSKRSDRGLCRSRKAESGRWSMESNRSGPCDQMPPPALQAVLGGTVSTGVCPIGLYGVHRPRMFR